MTAYEYGIEYEGANGWVLYNCGERSLPWDQAKAQEQFDLLDHTTSTKYRIVRQRLGWAPATFPTGERDDPWLRCRAGVQGDGHHLVELTLRNGDSRDIRDPETLTALLSPAAALELSGQLANYAQSQYETMVDSALRGDCKTCNNMRMVTVEKHGRDVQEHCPACSARPESEGIFFGRRPPPPLPTAPFWVEREAIVLRS